MPEDNPHIERERHVHEQDVAPPALEELHPEESAQVLAEQNQIPGQAIELKHGGCPPDCHDHDHGQAHSHDKHDHSHEKQQPTGIQKKEHGGCPPDCHDYDHGQAHSHDKHDHSHEKQPQELVERLHALEDVRSSNDSSSNVNIKEVQVEDVSAPEVPLPQVAAKEAIENNVVRAPAPLEVVETPLNQEPLNPWGDEAQKQEVAINDGEMPVTVSEVANENTSALDTIDNPPRISEYVPNSTHESDEGDEVEQMAAPQVERDEDQISTPDQTVQESLAADAVEFDTEVMVDLSQESSVEPETDDPKVEYEVAPNNEVHHATLAVADLPPVLRQFIQEQDVTEVMPVAEVVDTVVALSEAGELPTNYLNELQRDIERFTAIVNDSRAEDMASQQLDRMAEWLFALLSYNNPASALAEHKLQFGDRYLLELVRSLQALTREGNRLEYTGAPTRIPSSDDSGWRWSRLGSLVMALTALKTAV